MTVPSLVSGSLNLGEGFDFFLTFVFVSCFFPFSLQSSLHVPDYPFTISFNVSLSLDSSMIVIEKHNFVISDGSYPVV